MGDTDLMDLRAILAVSATVEGVRSAATSFVGEGDYCMDSASHRHFRGNELLVYKTDPKGDPGGFHYRVRRSKFGYKLVDAED